jgi:hypothetical protein
MMQLPGTHIPIEIQVDGRHEGLIAQTILIMIVLFQASSTRLSFGPSLLRLRGP